MTTLRCLGEGIWFFFTLWFYILAKFLKYRCVHFSLLPLVNLSFFTVFPSGFLSSLYYSEAKSSSFILGQRHKMESF